MTVVRFNTLTLAQRKDCFGSESTRAFACRHRRPRRWHPKILWEMYEIQRCGRRGRRPRHAGRVCSPECFGPTLAGTMQLDLGARPSRSPWPASRRPVLRGCFQHHLVRAPTTGGFPAGRRKRRSRRPRSPKQLHRSGLGEELANVVRVDVPLANRSLYPL
jgi:hypothetical protein